MATPDAPHRTSPGAPVAQRPARGARHFDRWAARYDRSPLQWLLFGPVHRAALDACSALGAAPRDVLDVGCGTGRLLERAAARWSSARLIGMDASLAMLQVARRKDAGMARMAFLRGDASAPPLAPARFDVIFSTISFHHWTRQAEGVAAVARLLRPSGLFVLADVDPRWPALSRPVLNRFDHANYQPPRAIRPMLEAAGFSIVLARRFWQLVPVQLYVSRVAGDPVPPA